MMNLDFTGKVAIVTGSNKGIGQCIAEMFAESGASVVVCGRKDEDTKKVVDGILSKGGKAIGVHVDVSSEDEVKAMVQKTLDTFGHVDILVNNAGLNGKGLIENTSLAEWHRVIEADLTGTFLCTREVMPHMKKQHFGRIINISSTVGKRRGYLGGCPYSAAKAGQLALTRHIGVEGGYYNVTCNAVCPGSTSTPLHKYMTPPEVQAKKAAQNPMGRLAEPEDQAWLTLFLASDYAGYINCQEISVDGGALINYLDPKTYHETLNKAITTVKNPEAK